MRKDWDLVGGFCEEYVPGYGHDPDFAASMWKKGCRTFVGLADSLVYHFGSKTTKRVKSEPYRHIFKRRHGWELDEFAAQKLRRGDPWPV